MCVLVLMTPESFGVLRTHTHTHTAAGETQTFMYHIICTTFVYLFIYLFNLDSVEAASTSVRVFFFLASSQTHANGLFSIDGKYGVGQNVFNNTFYTCM